VEILHIAKLFSSSRAHDLLTKGSAHGPALLERLYTHPDFQLSRSVYGVKKGHRIKATGFSVGYFLTEL